MARSTVKESDLGLEVTDEELADAAAEVEAAEDAQDDPEGDTEGDPPPQKGGKDDPEAAKAGEEEPKTAEETKTVDLRALQEARGEAREARQASRVMEQRLNDVLAMMQRDAQPEKKDAAAEIPDPDTDPQGAIRWAREQILAREQRDREANERSTQAQQQREASTRVMQEAMEEFTSAEKSDPEVRQAYAALVQSFQNEAAAYRLPPAETQRYMQQTEFQHIAYARQNNIPLADYIKGLASARGWRPGDAAQQPQEKEKPKTDPAAIAAAQERHQSLSDAPGGEAAPVLDAKALARMSDKEFKAWMGKKGNDAKFEEIMGKA